ncbi:MAG: NAD(P)H-dependent oxidoreductase [Planctomycetes bacterium]|nr:NAD(P)H-dependent oxidoreductase [Planctomycetota bacterium]
MKRFDPNKEETGARVLVVATSLNVGSKSQILAREAHERLQRAGVESELLDLRAFDLPFVDGSGRADENPEVQRLKTAFKRATHILLALPVYNGDVSATTRNLLNLGCNFHEKTVGFLCAAGGEKSYMAVVPLGNSLMFEFCSWIVPRYVFALPKDFENGEIANPDILSRIDRLIRDLLSRIPAAKAGAM